ncbi:hypothetical protein G9A89_003908 [Geosiphon pyriformis]|nr:hypothetical protein G9A89_003908 [Geosiphon pyriformis]
MLFEWSFGVVFELVVGADKLFGAVADKLLVVAVDKLEVNILAVDRLVAASLASKWFDIGFDLDNSHRVAVLKSGGNGGDQSPDGVGNHELNPSKYAPYGPNNSAFLCLLWNKNHPNADVVFDVAAPVDVILMVLSGI